MMPSRGPKLMCRVKRDRMENENGIGMEQNGRVGKGEDGRMDEKNDRKGVQ